MTDPDAGAEAFLAYDRPAWLRYAVENAVVEPGAGPLTWVPTGRFATSALTRVPRFPRETEGADVQELEIDAVRNERRHGQLAVIATEPISGLRADVTALDGPGDATLAEAVSVSYVGYVPVERSLTDYRFDRMEEIYGDAVSGHRRPDIVADPLLDRASIDVPSHAAQPVWITVDIPRDAAPGVYTGTVTLDLGSAGAREFPLEVTVEDVAIPDLSEGRFHLDVWFNPDAVAAEYGVERWSEEHWSLLDPYFEHLAAAGQETVVTALVENPWRGEWVGGGYVPQTETGFSSLVAWRRGADGSWRFDFERFDRYVQTAFDCGVGPYVEAYGMLAFNGPERIAYTDADGERTAVEFELGDDGWERAWRAFLTAFVDHLDERGWLDRTMLAFDEQSRDRVETVEAFIEEIAPALSDQTMHAGYEDTAAFAHNLTINQRWEFPTERIEARREEGKITTFYHALTPAHPNTFTYSPAVESRMIPWIAADRGYDGFLRWSYNSWPREVYENPVYKFRQGCEYFVYPGEGGPTTSIRWEQLCAGIGEFELLAQARERDISPRTVEDAIETVVSEEDARGRDLGEFHEARRAVIDLLAGA